MYLKAIVDLFAIICGISVEKSKETLEQCVRLIVQTELQRIVEIASVLVRSADRSHHQAMEWDSDSIATNFISHTFVIN